MKLRCEILRALISFALVLGCTQAHAEAVSDLVVGYSSGQSSRSGGQDALQAAVLAQVASANDAAARSGSPHRQRVAGFIQSADNCDGLTSTGGMVGWLRDNNAHVADVRAYADGLGADLVTYIFQNGDSVAGVAEQPGRYSAYNNQIYWTYFAHESGGHNFGGNHGDAIISPMTVMGNNYCGGGGANGYYTNPNIWQNGVKLQGGGNCTGGTIYGGDDAYMLSNAAQGKADSWERRVWGSSRGALAYRWQFNKPAGAAPAGTVITDEITSAQAIVRGQGATYTGTALRLPGGTTGNTAANSISAYLDLPNGIFSAMTNFTIEVWAAPQSASNWMRVIDIGRTTEAGDGLGAAGEYTGTAGSPAPGATTAYDDIMLSASIGTNLNSQRFEAKLAGAGTVTANSNLATTAAELHHYAVTFADTATGGTIKWFRDGAMIKTLNVAFHSASLHDVNNWLGRSMYSGDAMANIDYYDVRIQNVAIADGEVAGNYRIGSNDKTVTMWANDAWGNSGWLSGAWEFGQTTPDAGHDYETGTLRALTPWTTTDSTFPGRSLTVTSGNLFLTGKNAKTATINDLRLNGGTVISLGDNGSTQTLAGNITVRNFTDNQIRGANGPMIISANIAGGVGGGAMIYTEKAVTLTGNNTGYLGATIIGDGRFSTLKIASETQLGGNPTFYGGAWLQLNRGILETTQTMTIDDANRGVLVGPSGGFFRPAAGTTLTIAGTVNSPAAGNTLQTAPMDSNPIVGIFFKDGAGTLVLTSPNNSHNAEMQILQGELRIDGGGRINNGDHWMPVTLNSTLNYNSTATQTLRGAMSGTGSLIKNGTGTLNINGSNPFTGGVTINAGTLYANPGNAATNRAFSFVSGITVNGGGTLRAGSNGLFGWDGTQEKPIIVNTGGFLTANGGQTSDVGVGTVTLAGGTLATLAAGATDYGSWRFDNATDRLLVTDNSTASASNVKFGNAGASIEVAAGKTLNFTGTITDTTSGGISYLTKAGAGTLTLAGANAYSGATAINAGIVTLNGSIAAGSAVSVASGATLGGTGTVNGTLAFTANAIHAPGIPTGTQTIAGALGYANGSRVRWTLPASSDQTGASSRIAAGNVTVAAGAVVDIVLNAAGSTVNFTDSFWTRSRTWNVMSCANKTGDFTLGTVTGDAAGRPVSNYGTLSLQQNATTVSLVFTPYTPTEFWRQANFGANWNNPAISGDTVDGDGDGLSNLLEYALGTDPNLSTATSAPQVSTPTGKLRITFTRNTAASDVGLFVMAADDLSAIWAEIASSINGAAFTSTAGAAVNESGTGNPRTVQATDIYLTNDPAHPRRFMRLEVRR